MSGRSGKEALCFTKDTNFPPETQRCGHIKTDTGLSASPADRGARGRDRQCLGKQTGEREETGEKEEEKRHEHSALRAGPRGSPNALSPPPPRTLPLSDSRCERSSDKTPKSAMHAGFSFELMSTKRLRSARGAGARPGPSRSSSRRANKERAGQ